METLPQDIGCVIYRQPEPRLSLPEEAESQVWRDSQGRIVIPNDNLYGLLNGGLRKLRRDHRWANSFKGKRTIESALTIVDSDHQLVYKDDGGRVVEVTNWEVDVRRGRLSDGTRVSISRPKFRNWGFQIEVAVVDEVSGEELLELFILAGLLLGLGGFRGTGGFGKFEVISCELLSAAA